MSYIVDHLFPAFREDAADEFSNFSYWREPIQDLLKLEMLVGQNWIDAGDSHRLQYEDIAQIFTYRQNVRGGSIVYYRKY